MSGRERSVSGGEVIVLVECIHSEWEGEISEWGRSYSSCGIYT